MYKKIKEDVFFIVSIILLLLFIVVTEKYRKLDALYKAMKVNDNKVSISAPGRHKGTQKGITSHRKGKGTRKKGIRKHK